MFSNTTTTTLTPTTLEALASAFQATLTTLLTLVSALQATETTMQSANTTRQVVDDSLLGGHNVFIFEDCRPGGEGAFCALGFFFWGFVTLVVAWFGYITWFCIEYSRRTKQGRW